MTMRSKVWLFVAVAIGLVFGMGVELFNGTRRGLGSRHHLLLIQDQIDLYGQMHNSPWPFVEALRHSRRDGATITRLLREQDARMDRDFARLEELAHQESLLPTATNDLAQQEQDHERIARLHAAQHRWVRRAEQLARSMEDGAEVTPDAWWELFQDFEEQVGEQLEAAITTERAEMEALRRAWDERSRLGSRLAKLVPSLGLLLMLGIALAILDPMQRSLRELLEGAERIGRGDFEKELPVKGGDELGTLAQAFNRMSAQLRELMHERQRYNARLEDTVHVRTAELASTNARLEDSLQQLRQAQDQLLVSDRLATLGRLAAGVGHEINNPLAYILSNLRYVQEELDRTEGSPSSTEREELLSAVIEAYEGAERVRLIAQDLKVLSRQDDATYGPVELLAVVRSAAKMAAHEIQPRARFVADCEDVPPVRGNGARLGQVLLNLLINAAHAIEPGQVEQNEIRVLARQSGPSRVTLEVRDTGCGIPSENLERIFEPFFTTKPVGVGTGLGLPVCRNIIEALSGELTVESQPGRGSTFRITLPVAEDAAFPGQAA
ncbi:ATP-binding protein [Archangium sp.]|uniref:sensor histidine kinase n=1 Tax=Archangium sp. TaxID=1872627 RepID=UPI0038998D4A